MHPIQPQDNGILARIRGEEIAAGIQGLPPPETGQPELMSIEVGTLHNGRVLITYRLRLYKRSRRWYGHWAASRAVPVLH